MVDSFLLVRIVKTALSDGHEIARLQEPNHRVAKLLFPIIGKMRMTTFYLEIFILILRFLF